MGISRIREGLVVELEWRLTKTAIRTEEREVMGVGHSLGSNHQVMILPGWRLFHLLRP